ncbi:hypothetical protein H4F26_13875 [Vibrio alginolyticus]|uniref:hypothetical protein n=1 Tax=Vibrio TaxID=662 RepID=UPI00188125DB|nr:MULTISPECIES: hypothetical protein [unclassified Vibrio]MBE8570657.1 hypothetical protein [Vibrio sp. OPT46]MBE8581373.1 hypothetical protein [Vibrio sp. OPT41]
MNPIDKVTDPSFTESAKGLMVIFCIGAIHLVIGVELTNAKIAIPWFPTVNFKHPEYLVYLYWALSFYAMYRYSLHNAILIRKEFFQALYESLRGPTGKKFISEAILLQGAPYLVERKNSKNNEISILGYIPEQDPKTGEEVQNNVFYFTFKFNKDYQFEEILASSDPGWDVSEACFNHEEIRQKWGLDLFIDEDRHEEYRSTFIRSKTYNLKLVCIRIKPFLGTLLSQKEIFDLCIPLILNTSLFFAWVIKASFT